MIARLEGVLREKSPTRVVVDVGGVGYDVLIPLSTFSDLPDEGKTVALSIHTHMREGTIQLFGFGTTPERAAFELLLRASRVGPKLAQTILSGISPQNLVGAIRSADVGSLQAVPGVGPKLAARILVELRDRVGDLPTVPVETAGGAPLHGAPRDARNEQALSALVNLGYSRAHAETVMGDAEPEVGPDAAVEELIRAALRRLSR